MLPPPAYQTGSLPVTLRDMRPGDRSQEGLPA